MYFLPFIIATVCLVVYLLYRWVRVNAFFQSMILDENDPALVELASLAQFRLPEFDLLLQSHSASAFVKIQYPVSDQRVEHVWARAMEKISAVEYLVEVQVRENGTLSQKTLIVQKGDIEDWQVGINPRQIRGGFSTQYMFWLKQKQLGYSPVYARKMLNQYTDRIDVEEVLTAKAASAKK